MAHAYAERIEHRVGNGCCDRTMGCLTGANRVHLRPLDQLDVDVRHLAEAEDRIFRPAGAGDALPVEADAFLQYPAGGLDSTALDLVDDAIWIDGFADVDREGQFPDADVFGAFYLGNHGTVGAGVLVARKADAVSDADLLLRLPLGTPCGSADHVLCPLIPQMTQPESDRIVTAPGGDFVEEGFDRKHITLRAECSQRRRADWHGLQAMTFDLPGWEIIERYGVAIAAATIGLRRIGRDHPWKRGFQLEPSQQGWLRRTPRPRRMAVAPDRVAPIDNFASGIEIGLDLNRHGGTKGRIRHLVFARPLHAHRPATGGPGEQHGVERDVVSRVMSVAAGALQVFDRNVIGRQFQNQCKIGAQE